MAKISLQHDDAISGTVARMGITIIEITGTVGAEIEPPVDGERMDFYFKFQRAPEGHGFDEDPWIVYCTRRTETRAVHAVHGTLALHDSRFDPVADIPVLGDVEITLSQRQSSQRGRLVQRVPAADLLPYAHQRYDDFPAATKDH